MYDDILIPSDGSEHAVRAAEHGAYIADAFDATLHLLTVVDVDAAAGPFSAGGVDEEYVGRLKSKAQTAIDALDDAVSGVETVQSSVVTGQPSTAVLDYVADRDVDLVAMGTRGRRGLSRYLVGSVAERVVRRSPVPVLTVRATERSAVGEGYDDILVPTDGSDYAAAAVAHALAIAERADARVHAVSVVNLGDVATGTEVGVPPKLVEQFETLAEEAVESVATAAREAGLDVETSVRTGVPARELLDYAEENPIDLVAMGTHGRTGWDRLLLGSTAERLVRRSPIPVLTVRRSDEEDET
ncbi:universal stress protein [Haloarcula nitratireducens]|uniref:Universal stress protein n=1 Tax=Haloarcula nitratireducens TaxID=2487749 RepID=A0AAW4PA93_9EURY|nr:universal stress protein [Halomicroarcula nitratireducens]MBX0294580.1 universal stress protein [Halomicroarcula nitratireducens]